MKKFKITKSLSTIILTLILVSCSSNDDMQIDPSVNLEKNTVTSTNAKGSLNYFTIADIGNYFQLTISENSPNLQNPSFGVKVDLMLKTLPTQTSSFMHRVEADFNLVSNEYFLNSVDFKTEKWHVPFINSRPTNELNVTVENNIATFTIVEVELSDNFVAPITNTDKISLSFSIPLAELNANSNVFRDLAK